MTDDNAVDTPVAEDATFDQAEADRQARRSRKRSKRLRTALALVLALLVLLLLTLSAFVVRLMTPVGSPDTEEVTQGMTWIRSMYGWGKREDQHLYAPSDVAIGPDGVIWTNDPARFQLVAFNPDGSYRSIIMQGPGYMMPQTFDVSDDNEIYVGDFANQKIRVFSPDNKELRSWDSSLPTEVAVEGERVVVGQRDRIAVYDLKGKLIREWGTRGRGEDQVDIVRGVEIGPDGTIYVSDTQNHRLKAYTPEGKMKWVYPTNEQFAAWFKESQTDETVKQPFQLPAGMTFDAAGRLVLVDPFEFRIMIIDPKNGKVVASYGDFGETDGKFGYPTSISYDPTRDWFAVADTANDRVQIVRIEGSGGGPLSGLARAAVGPVWVCAIPLVLLLIALIVAMIRRRRAKRAADATEGMDNGLGDAEDVLESADTPLDPDVS